MLNEVDLTLKGGLRKPMVRWYWNMGKTSTQITSYLVEKGLIQREDLEKILPPGQPPGDCSVEDELIHSGLISEEQFCEAVEEFFGVPFASVTDLPQEPVLINHLTLNFMKESKFVPIRLQGNELTVAMGNPLDYYTIDAIRVSTNYEIKVLYMKEDTVMQALDQYYGAGTTMEKIIEDMNGIPEYRTEEENIDQQGYGFRGPVIRLVNLIITRAIELRASDIHFGAL
jgi:hypothetical protein